jgi:pimeloyl-ACP methyl ester carboxylesterase
MQAIRVTQLWVLIALREYTSGREGRQVPEVATLHRVNGREIASVFEEVAGVGRARVLVAGDGGEPLLFVHGWPACARIFWPFLTAPALHARFRMQAPDLFGFGRSTLVAPRLTFEHEVELVLAVARRAGAPCVAVGASFGARVLLEAASRAPALFRRVVLLAPYLHRGVIERSLEGRLLARFPRQIRALHHPPWSLLTGGWAAAQSLLAGRASASCGRQALPLIADVARLRAETVDLVNALPDGRPQLTALGVPVEIWYGDRDRLLDTRELVDLASLRGLTVVRVAGGGHALHDTHVTELVAALLATDRWRPVLRALIEAILAFDHPAAPAAGVEQVERPLVRDFSVEGESGAALRAGLAAFDAAFAAQAGVEGPFAAAPLAARRAFLRCWARSEAPAQRRFYASVKAMVLMTAYGLPAFGRAIGHEGPL